MSELSVPREFDLRRFLLRRLARLGIMLTWYVLSIGPMFWQWHHAVHSTEPSLVVAFYYPLSVACEKIPVFGDMVNAYVNLWIL